MASLKLWSESFMIWSDSFRPQRKEWHFFTLEAGLHNFFRTSTGCVLNKVFPNWGSSCHIQAVQDFTHTRGHLLTSMPRPSGCFCLISLWCSYTANLSSSSFSRVLSSLPPVYPRKSTSFFGFVYAARSSNRGHWELSFVPPARN